jgi:hypothetical protein
MSLKAELDAFRSDLMAKVSPEIREAMARADRELAVSGAAHRALKAGNRAPDFRLPTRAAATYGCATYRPRGPLS